MPEGVAGDESDRQLGAIAEVLDVARGLDVAVWLRGGWAMDFFLGEITRPHQDVDWFVWSEELPQLKRALAGRGWADRAEHPPGQQIDLERQGVELSFAPLARNSHGGVVVGGGPWAGSAWPAGMIEHAVNASLAGISCQIISPAAQIEIKRMMPVWVPGRPRRKKDADDIARLRTAIASSFADHGGT